MRSSSESAETNEARFAFGENWRRFLERLDVRRIERAEASLREALRSETLEGRSFLDVGSGSGLFSLAARRLGARVHSFDFDPESVACTGELRSRYFPRDEEWRVDQGSVLDREFLSSLGSFDIVYSWGVLHHTGRLWEALEKVSDLVNVGGVLYVAIYNDQGVLSRFWKRVKIVYNALPSWLRPAFTLFVMLPREALLAAFHLFTLRAAHYLESRRNYDESRGMSWWCDAIDWVGGYPFEVAKPEQVLDFLHPRGFDLVGLRTCGGGLGCNEFVFRRVNG